MGMVATQVRPQVVQGKAHSFVNIPRCPGVTRQARAGSGLDRRGGGRRVKLPQGRRAQRESPEWLLGGAVVCKAKVVGPKLGDLTVSKSTAQWLQVATKVLGAVHALCTTPANERMPPRNVDN